MSQRPDPLHIRHVTAQDADAVYKTVHENRAFLSHLVWAETATLESVREFIVRTNDSESELWGIFVDGECAGMVEIRVTSGFDTLGYWLAEKFCGQGIMTYVVQLLTRNMDQPIEAKIKRNNLKSRNVLTRAGFIKYEQFNDWEFFILKPRGGHHV